MNFVNWFVTNLARLGTDVICRIDASDLQKVPVEGPLILFSNHTGQIEVPLLFSHLYPRSVTGLAKVETWDNWFLNFIFTVWGAIPVNRGEADMTAIRMCLKVLEENKLLAIAPEGTRNKTGILNRAHPGIVTIALRSGAPLMPVVHWGGEKTISNLRSLKRTDFYIRVGKPIRLDPRGEHVTREVRQKMVDEMMYLLAAMLPEYYRGTYSDLDNATTDYLVEI